MTERSGWDAVLDAIAGMIGYRPPPLPEPMKLQEQLPESDAPVDIRPKPRPDLRPQPEITMAQTRPVPAPLPHARPVHDYSWHKPMAGRSEEWNTPGGTEPGATPERGGPASTKSVAAPAPQRREPERSPAFDTAAFFRQQDASRFAKGGAPKVDKATARYQSHPSGRERCAGCSMFQPPHACTAVEGSIAPRGWCMYFEAGRKAGGAASTRARKEEVERDPGDSQWALRNPRIAEAMENGRLEFDMPGGHYMPDELPGGADAVMPHMNPWAADERMPQFPSWPWLRENQEYFDRRPRGYADGGAIAESIARAEGEVDRNPTEAQKKSGNYAKGHVSFHGLDVTIENAEGSWRSGKDKGGKTWQVKMPAAYGYVKGTEGKDGDHVDVYLGPKHDSERVFVVDQVDAGSGKFDEHKAMLFYPSQGAALVAYRRAFSDGKGDQRVGCVTAMTIDSFKAWLKDGDTTKPVGKLRGGK